MGRVKTNEERARKISNRQSEDKSVKLTFNDYRTLSRTPQLKPVLAALDKILKNTPKKIG